MRSSPVRIPRGRRGQARTDPGRAEPGRTAGHDAVGDLVYPGGHPVVDTADRVLRRGSQCLDLLVGHDRVDQSAGAAGIGSRQVDLAGYAPGTVAGPPQVRALAPGSVHAGQRGDKLGRPRVQEVVPMRQVHPRPSAHCARHRVPPRPLDNLARLPRRGQDGGRAGERPSRSSPTRRTSSPAAWRSNPARCGQDPGVRHPQAALLRGPGCRTGAAGLAAGQVRPAAARPDGTARPFRSGIPLHAATSAQRSKRFPLPGVPAGCSTRA